MTSTIEEFYDVGVPVDVQGPPPDQVQEAMTTRVPVPAPAPGPTPRAAATTPSPTVGPVMS